MNEMAKTRAIWTPEEAAILVGDGIDIGCGSEKVKPTARGFDTKDGDANCITKHVSGQFDYVFSSHCLEHMLDPYSTICDWWSIVKPGGHLFFIVPDEDLYEQGFWPSRFNPDHKWTFTISKDKSWSPKSVNLLDVCIGYQAQGAEIVCLKLQDHGYDRSRLRVDQTTGVALAQIQCILKKPR
jgi:SAM-dependent methyltransferase